MAKRTNRSVSVDFDLGGIEAYGEVAKSMPGIIGNSINRTSTWAKHEIEGRIRTGLSLPAGYLVKNGRLGFTRASHIKHKASLIARFRPNLLTTYALNSPTSYKDRARPIVEVTPGRVKGMDNAFYVKLKNGRFGVAMREDTFRQYAKMKGFSGTAKSFGGIVLLHGPSVDQHFALAATEMEEAGQIQSMLGSQIFDEMRRKGIPVA